MDDIFAVSTILYTHMMPPFIPLFYFFILHHGLVPLPSLSSPKAIYMDDIFNTVSTTFYAHMMSYVILLFYFFHLTPPACPLTQSLVTTPRPSSKPPRLASSAHRRSLDLGRRSRGLPWRHPRPPPHAADALSLHAILHNIYV
jgi:hypothetical protein